jgi:serine/threonine-protein kinase HipA
MRSLEVHLDWGEEERILGTLAEREGRVYFEYAPAFLEAPLPISPFKLPARSGLFEHEDREFGPVFGVFLDSLPDGWGLLLMDRVFRTRGVDPASVSPLDRLAYIGTRGMGALSYHPPPSGSGVASGSAGSGQEESGQEESGQGESGIPTDLGALSRQAGRLVAGSAEDVLPALRLAGGSPGGARPKVVLAVHPDGRALAGAEHLPEGFREWLVKFPGEGDPPEIGRVEFAYAAMAREAGVRVPASTLFVTAGGVAHFATERFDLAGLHRTGPRRTGPRRLHMHTLGGLLHASHRIPSLEYEGFLRATLLLTRDLREVEEAFRRMALNVLSHNRDDHVKNFSYLMDRSGTWRLAPAYDLVFSNGPGGGHTMAVHGEAGHPGEKDMLRVALRSELDAARAREIIGEVRDAVSQWPRFAEAAGVPTWASKRIAGAIATAAGRP